MGWSCTAAADNSMRAIQDTLPSKSNFWKDDEGQEFFLELGREQTSGAITGTVFDERAYKKGGLKIEPSGYITRWAHLPRASREEMKKLNIAIKRDIRSIEKGVDKYFHDAGYPGY